MNDPRLALATAAIGLVVIGACLVLVGIVKLAFFVFNVEVGDNERIAEINPEKAPADIRGSGESGE